MNLRIPSNAPKEFYVLLGIIMTVVFIPVIWAEIRSWMISKTNDKYLDELAEDMMKRNKSKKNANIP